MIQVDDEFNIKSKKRGFQEHLYKKYKKYYVLKILH